MAKGRGDGDSVGDDLEVIELVTDERKSAARRPEPDAGHEDRPPGRRRLLVLAIAAVVVAVAGVSVVVTRDDGDAEAGPANRGTSNASRTTRDVVPSSTATTQPGQPLHPTTAGDASTTAPLLPEGAPSTPHIGELVAFAAGGGFDPGSVSSAYYLYADGRLLRWSEAGGGFVEQRLTPEGVERVRSEFLASGLFDPTQPQPGPSSGCAGPLCVRGDDGRMLSAPQSAAGPEQLVSYLGTLDASLPRSEWATLRVRTYVASRFNVCIGTYANVPDRAIPVQIDLSTVFPALPTEAAELFASREAHDGGGPPCMRVFETTLEEARALADLFLGPTGGGTHQYGGIVIRNAELDAIPSAVSVGIIPFITFQPLLPDGTPGPFGP